ncbi:MAG: bifunctional folylpolyglutamate synthase/dihydrofolate synthase [Vicinamibacterales bacterium]
MSVPTQDPIAYLFGLEQFGIKLGLKTIRRLVASLGAPERTFHTILVAGTNGKGSVAAMVEHGLRTSGLRVGLFTSPHLVKINERFMLNGQCVDTTTLKAGAQRIKDTVNALIRSGDLKHHPTFFEATTALAFVLFEQASVDIAVVEVGMGGRFDATNMVTPIGIAIPSIDIDHQQFLGDTLEEIAYEKAGVIKPNSLVVTTEEKKEPLKVLRSAVTKQNARLVQANIDVEVMSYTKNGLTFIEKIMTPHRCYGPLQLSLRGHHQINNALVAVRLLEELSDSGIDVPAKAIVDAITKVRWPGRLELVKISPKRNLLLDPAHNVAAAAKLSAYINQWRPQGLPFVFSALRDKDVSGILRALDNAITHIVCTSINSSRAQSLEQLTQTVREIRPDISLDANKNLSKALDLCWNKGPLAVVTGSVFLVGAVRETLALDDQDSNTSLPHMYN